MARQDPATGRYDLGPHAIRFGLAALARVDAFAEADPAVAAFVRETGRTALIAALGPAGPTIVRWHPGAPAVTTSLAVGSVLPLLHSATGHAFLAFLSDAELDGVAGEAARSAEVAAVRRRVRAAVAAAVDGTVIPGLRATAVPILDLQGRPALVATMLATSALDPAGDAAATRHLQDACRGATEAIGGTWPPG